jgi:hypothetical protein
LQGAVPASQGLQLVSGTLVGTDTLASIGLTASRTITANTLPETYTITVLGDPVNYQVTKVAGTWIVNPALFGYADSDNDGIPDYIENDLFGGLGVLSSSDAEMLNSQGDLYSRVIKAMGGGNDSLFYTSAAWTISTAKGNSLPAGIILVSPCGQCFKLNTSDLTLSTVKW